MFISSKRKMFKDALVYVEGEGIVRTDLSFTDRVETIGMGADGTHIRLPDDAIVLPGFIDEHIHGAGGADTMDGTQDALATIAKTVAAEGTTAFCATTMTRSEEEILKALAAVREYVPVRGARLLGAHLEGPFIAEKYKGAQSAEHVAAPSLEQFEKFYEESGKKVKLVTLAAEREGAEELIAHLKERGVIASIGHSGASFADMVSAVSVGATHITHTFNAQSPLHHREAGVVGAALLLDELSCELIADTVHVSVPAMRLLLKNKPLGKLILITDAIRAKGLGDGVSELGGQTVYVRDGQARLADGTLAGSVLKMNVALKNLVTKVGADLETAVDCATINPARDLGLAEETGSIKVGKRADFAVLSPSFEVLLTIVGGKIIYRNL